MKARSDAENVFKWRMHLLAENAPGARRRLVPGGMYRLGTHGPPLAALHLWLRGQPLLARSFSRQGKGRERQSWPQRSGVAPAAAAPGEVAGRADARSRSVERARRRSGRRGGAHAGAGASPARGGKRRRAGWRQLLDGPFSPTPSGCAWVLASC